MSVCEAFFEIPRISCVTARGTEEVVVCFDLGICPTTKTWQSKLRKTSFEAKSRLEAFSRLARGISLSWVAARLALRTKVQEIERGKPKGKGGVKLFGLDFPMNKGKGIWQLALAEDKGTGDCSGIRTIGVYACCKGEVDLVAFIKERPKSCKSLAPLGKLQQFTDHLPIALNSGRKDRNRLLAPF